MPPSDAIAPAVSPPSARLALRDMRRLRGRGSLLNLTGSYGLWLAGDFLLHLKRVGYTEEIQRFAYRDIQALEICGSSRWVIYSLVLGLPMLLFFLLGVGESSGRDWLTGCWVAAGLLLFLLLANLALGPTCHCVLQTALGPQVLPSLSRQRAARRAVALIAERVEAAQAEEGRR